MGAATALPPGVTAAVLRVNGEDRAVVFPTHHTLLEVLREQCGLTGTKHGCELGECGACAVQVDGEAVLSCLKLAVEVGDSEVEDCRGIAERQRIASAANCLCRFRRRTVRLLHARHPHGRERLAGAES